MRGTRANVADAAWRVIRETQAQDYALETGDILVTKSSGSSDLVGKATLFIHPLDGKTYLFSNFTLRLRPNRKLVLPEFLAWFLRSPQSLLWRYESQQNAVGLRNLQTAEFLGQRIPVPPLDIQKNVVQYLNLLEAKKPSAIAVPLPSCLGEKRVIVARIEQLAAKIKQARTLREEVSREADGIMASEEMTIWPEAAPREARTLGDVTDYLARGRQSQQGNSDHYLIKTQHVQLGRYVPTLMTLAPHAAGKVNPEAMVRTGDVLIACSAAGCLGRVAFYMDEGRKASTDTHVAIARAKAGAVLPQYLYHYLKGAQGQVQLRSREKGNWQRQKIGFRLTELNVADMRRVPVPVPPLPEQRRVVAYLDGLQAKVDALKRLQAETAAELDALLPSILDRAFRGDL